MTRARAAAGLAVGVLVAACLAAGFVREFSGDFHWHVVVGRRVLSGSLGQTDVFSHTFAGGRVFISSWLADALFAAAFAAGGYPACFVLRALAVLATFGLVCREMTRRGLPAWAAASACLLALSFLLFKLYLRPEVFAFAAMAGLLHLLGAEERAPSRWRLGAVLALVALWANLHGSVGIGLLTVGLWSAEQVLRRLRDRRRRIVALALPPAAFLAAGLNPEGIAGPLAFRILSPTWVAHVPEWQPLRLASIPPALEALLLLAAVTTVAAGRRASPWRAALTAVLVALSFRYARFISFALLASLPLVAGNVVAIAGRLGERARARPWRIAAGALAGLAMGWGLGNLLVERRLLREVGLGIDPAWYPVDACRFAREHPMPGRMLNSYDFGSWLMFCLPEQKVFIDQRAWSLYPDEFYRRYLDAARSTAALRDLADRTQVSWAFVTYDPIAARLGDDREGWKLVYFDDQALLYVRAGVASPVPPFLQIAPDRVAALAVLRGEPLAAARAELDVQRARCPACQKTRLVDAALAVAAGDDEAYRRAIGPLVAAGETPETAWLAARHALDRSEWSRADELAVRFLALGGDRLAGALLRAEAHARGGDPEGASRLLDEASRLPGGADPASRARAVLLGR